MDDSRMLLDRLLDARATQLALAHGADDAARRFTGERFLPGYTDGATELEHVHRYCFALPYVAGRRVLDVACGEGYGSDLLAQVAGTVLGIDIDGQTVLRAAARYRRPNLNFMAANATFMPIEHASIDVVTSFETIEHIEDQAGFWREVKRVLSPHGLLIISSPNRETYRAERSSDNKFHARELSEDELEAGLSQWFAYHQTYGQAIVFGSLLMPLPDQSPNCLPYSIISLDNETNLLSWRIGREILSPYSLAVASDVPVETAGPSLYAAHYPPNAMAALVGGLAERDHLAATLRDQLGSARAEKDQIANALTSAFERVRLLSATIAEQDRSIRSLQQALTDANRRFTLKLQAVRREEM